MKRFHPLEVFIWKAFKTKSLCFLLKAAGKQVEGLPSARLHSPNDVFCEVGSFFHLFSSFLRCQVSFGYNVVMKTRVHHGAGHSCTFKDRDVNTAASLTDFISFHLISMTSVTLQGKFES